MSSWVRFSSEEFCLKVHPKERFHSEHTLTPAEISAYALAAGDNNPIHHDAKFAANTRYGRVIASGTHTTALLLGLTASHFSKIGAMVHGSSVPHVSDTQWIAASCLSIAGADRSRRTVTSK
jgi:acyl dehydratase